MAITFLSANPPGQLATSGLSGVNTIHLNIDFTRKANIYMYYRSVEARAMYTACSTLTVDPVGIHVFFIYITTVNSC